MNGDNGIMLIESVNVRRGHSEYQEGQTRRTAHQIVEADAGTTA